MCQEKKKCGCFKEDDASEKVMKDQDITGYIFRERRGETYIHEKRGIIYSTGTHPTEMIAGLDTYA